MLVQNLVSDKPPLGSLLLILLNVFLGFVIVGPVLGLAVSSLFYDGDLLKDIQSPEIHPDVIGPLLVTQSIATLVGLILFPGIQLLAIEHKKLSPFFPSQQKTLLILFLVALLGMTFIVSISPLAEWNMGWKFPEFMKGFETWARQEEDRLTKLTQAMTSFGSAGDLLIGLFVIALLPAIGEELVFRGLIQNEFFRGTGNAHLSIWISAFIFSAIHLQFYGFIPRLLLGVLFGYLYYWSGNLLIPMFAHFFNNAFGVIMIYLNNQKITDINVEDNVAAPLHYVIVNLILTVGLLYYIWKHYHELPKQESNSAVY
jgi:membrane protease YdiL (CAAX protease family)